LHLACQKGYYELCKMLIERGADVKARNEAGCTPLHEAVLAPEAARVTALLIRHGADMNAKDAEDRAPLHKASSMGHLDHCRALLDIGADINILDQSKFRAEKHNLSPLKGAVGIGDSALHYAILSGNLEICTFLLDRGIDLTIKSALGKPIVHFACHHKKYKICGLLIDRGAKIDALDYKQVQLPIAAPQPLQRRLSTAAVDMTLTAMGRRHSTSSIPSPNSSFSRGASSPRSNAARNTNSSHAAPALIMQSFTYSETALQNAAQSGNTEACAFLLSKGAAIHSVDEIFANTALHLAAQEGYYDVCEILLRHGADMHAKNVFFDSDAALNREETPLHLAAREGHWDLCRLLLQRGANARLRNRQGQDCLAVMDRSIRTAVVRLWRSLQRESSGREETAASIEKDNPGRLLSNSQHSHHDSEVTGTLIAAYSRLKLSAPPGSPTESGAHSEDPSPGAYSAGASTPATSCIPPTPHTPQPALSAGALSPLPTALTPTGSPTAHSDIADTYVLPPFFGPERIWKLRRVRFSTRKNMFKATVWEHELLEIASRPGEGAWVTIHPLLPDSAEPRRVPLVDTPPIEFEKVSKAGEAGDLRLLFCEPGARHSYLKISFGRDRARRSAWKAAAVKHLRNGRPPVD
jgi:ankyrin repeat protein